MKGLKKLGGLFLATVFLFVGIVNTKAYDETNTVSNNNIDWNFLGVDEDSNDIKVEDLITIKASTENNRKDDSAKVSLQFVEITEAQFNDITDKYKAYLTARDSGDVTAGTAAKNAYIKSIPNFTDSWTELTLAKSDTTANQYTAKIDETKQYFVAWVKIEIGSTVTYGYNVSCLAHVYRTCTPYNGKWYNKKGEVVTEEAYIKDCLSCEPYGDKFINTKGEIVDEAAYKKDCNPNCEPKDGKYFDDNGNEITKSQFDKLCGNPKTGNQTFYLYGIATIAVAFVLYMFTRKIRKFSK